MSRMKRPWFVILVLHLFSVFIFLLQINSNGAEYVEQFLESVEVCTSGGVGPFSNLAKKKIRLGNYPNNTVMVKLTRWDEFWPSFLNFRCKFQVTAPKKYGVMVVIQAMHLRKKSQFTCKDSIKFEQDDGFKTGEICGDLSEKDLSKSSEFVVGQRYFYDNKGLMDVSFATSDKDEQGDSKPVFLKLIFTAYSECSPVAIGGGKQKQCSAYRSHSCIPPNLFCDGEINCGFNDEDFGADERNCGGSNRQGKSEDGEKSFSDRPASLYVFAITCVATLVVVIILVLIACCCIRRFATRAHQQQQHNHHGGSSHLHHLELHLDTSMPSVVTQPTPERNEKPIEDLPPPYEALFPVSEKKE